MQHPEEGIIHAWLDGALSAEEGAALESHVATCAECGERVAEARGLIAASSRIVSTLDLVPGGVIPAAPKKHNRWVRPSLTAIAATLVFAISLYSTRENASKAPVPGSASEVTQLQVLDSAKLAKPEQTAATSEAPAAPPTIGPVPTRPAARQSTGNLASVGVTSGNQVAAMDSAVLPPPPPSAAAVPKFTPQVQTAPLTVAEVARRERQQRADSARVMADASVGRAAVGGGAGAAAGARSAAAAMRAPAPATASADEVTATARLLGADGLPDFVGCYEMNVSTDILPVRFALVRDSAGPNQFAVRYLDANGRPGERVLDAAWTPVGTRAVVQTVSRGTILTLTKTGTAVRAESPNGPRTGRVTSCR